MDILKEWKGSTVKTRFRIDRLLGEGSCAKIYKCIDLKDVKRPLVMKVAEKYKVLMTEIKAIKKVG
jgi:hypothetical protein